MALLVLGVLLFAGVHFIPSLGPGIKAAWVGKLGENGFKGVFSLLLLASFALMIFGWRGTTPSPLYAPPLALHTPALVLVALGFLVMGAANRKSRIRRFVRHPQLTGVAMWGVAHLLMNGEDRSVILFGGLTLWAIGEIFAINRREGVWIKEEPPGWGAEFVTVLIAVAVVGVLVAIHPWISGVQVW
ncbi:MAG: NnrU protein [Halioglobus sp.]|nr:NnrU protein [Halioglobus sp.]